MKFYLAGAIYAIALFLLVFALTSNAQTLPTDKFVWEGKVRIVVDTPTRIKEECRGLKAKRGPNGCARKDGDVHVMYIIFRHSLPTLPMYHEVIGHEVDHFIRGKFHD